MSIFDGSRRRAFDRNNNSDQNATGYSEKTVFPTDFGSPENNFQNGYAQPTAPQNSGYDGYAQNSSPTSGVYTQPTQQNYGYAQQNAAPVTTAQMSELPMVFASRTHRDVYIYEYSDRLEYYLKTATSMYLFDTVRKQ